MFNRESSQLFTKFSLVGLINTLVHFIIVSGLVELLFIHPVVANGLAFICANLFSFWANSCWSFRVAMSRQRYTRFLTVSLLGLAVSLSASSIGEALHWHYLAGVLLSFIFLPPITFLAHRSWTWKSLD